MLRTSQIGEAQCEVKNMEKAKAMQMLDIDGLQRVFEEMHKYIAEKVTKNRARQIKHHNKKTNLIVPDFGLWDFVLVRRAQNKRHKQSVRWIGPRRAVNVVGELVYDVENVITNKVEGVHASRLLTYRADFDGKSCFPRSSETYRTQRDEVRARGLVCWYRRQQKGWVFSAGDVAGLTG